MASLLSFLALTILELTGQTSFSKGAVLMLRIGVGFGSCLDKQQGIGYAPGRQVFSADQYLQVQILTVKTDPGWCGKDWVNIEFMCSGASPCRDFRTVVGLLFPCL